jgi:hypothetical protein
MTKLGEVVLKHRFGSARSDNKWQKKGIRYRTELSNTLLKLFGRARVVFEPFAGKPPVIEATALRYFFWQPASLIRVARAFALDTGPIGRFDTAGVDWAFFPASTGTSNFICRAGYGEVSGRFLRPPRFERHGFGAFM